MGLRGPSDKLRILGETRTTYPLNPGQATPKFLRKSIAPRLTGLEPKPFYSTVTKKVHMEQKDYIMEIVESLRQKNCHLRGLAKMLQTNQTTIARKMKGLARNNVVDFRREGKNKVFFLKKNIEAREYLCLAEHYKLLWLLQKHPSLKSLAWKIQRHPRVTLAILFGSYAKESSRKESDIDIYIETTSRELKKELELLDSRLSIKIGSYIKESLLIKEIEKEHIIIKGVELYYEKSSFFS